MEFRRVLLRDTGCRSQASEGGQDGSSLKILNREVLFDERLSRLQHGGSLRATWAANSLTASITSNSEGACHGFQFSCIRRKIVARVSALAFAGSLRRCRRSGGRGNSGKIGRAHV